MRRFVVLGFLFVACVACSSAGASRSYTDDTPTEPPPTTDLGSGKDDAKTDQTKPVDTSTDASTPDAGDTCGRTPPSNVCGLDPQCGCGPGETCDLADLSGGVECVTAGKGAMGVACTSTAGCALGLSCLYGTCHAFCSNAGTACTAPGTGKCIQAEDDKGVAIPNAKACAVKCSLVDPNSCGGTNAAGTGVCFVDDAGATDCQAGGTKADGATCTGGDCGPGLGCITITQNGATSNVCKKWCRVGQNDCGAGKTCTGFGTKLIVDGVEHGTCP